MKDFDIQLAHLLIKAFEEIENNNNLTSFVGGETVDDIINKISNNNNKNRQGNKELGIISDKVIDLIYETSPIYEVDEEYLDTRVFQDEVSIISDDAIEYINKKTKKHKISNKYKNTKLF